MPQGNAAGTADGDFISSTTDFPGLNTYYRYFLEVPPTLNRLRVQLFDADIGAGGAAEATDDRDRTRGTFGTTAVYTLIDPNGTTQATLTCSATLCAADDNVWATLWDSSTAGAPTTAPAFVNNSTATRATAGTSLAIPYPSGIVAGDLLVATLSHDGTGTINTPANWTLVNEGTCPGNNCRLGVYYLLATGSMTGSLTISWANNREAVGAILHYTGVDQTSPINGTSTSATGTSVTPSAPTMTTTVANTRVVRVFGANTNVAITATPTGHTSWYGLPSSTSGTATTAGGADTTQATAAPTGAANWTIFSSQAWRGVSLAIRAPNGPTSFTAGHWELDVNQSSAVTTGSDLNAFGVRADNGSQPGSTQVNVYYDSHTQYGNNPGATLGATRSYDLYPYITSGCSCFENDFDYDVGNGTGGGPSPYQFGEVQFWTRSHNTSSSSSDRFFDLASASLSANDVWAHNTVGGTTPWATPSQSIEDGIWHVIASISTYTNGSGANGNYANEDFTNFLDTNTSGVPAANPTANAFRVYLPNDSGGPAAKAYLEQLLTWVSGPNPPVNGSTTRVDVTIRVVNPEQEAITFSTPSNIVTAYVPGLQAGLGTAYYAGSTYATVNQGSIVSQPGAGAGGTIQWNPGSVAAGATAILSYMVDVHPTASGVTVLVTGAATATNYANGTKAQYVDNTGNTTQARATYTFGPICGLSLTEGVKPTVAVVSGLHAYRDPDGVKVVWTTSSEVGTVAFELQRWDVGKRDWVPVNKQLVPALPVQPEGRTVSLLDPDASLDGPLAYRVVEIEANGTGRVHGPFRVPIAEPAPVVSVAAPALSPVRRAPAVHAATSTGTAGLGRRISRSDGPLKIGVEQPGIYLVSNQAIAAATGVRVTDVAALVGNGGFGLSNRGNEVAWTPAPGNAGVLFYAEAIDSIYTRDNVYWLERRHGTLMRGVSGGSPAPAAPASFLDTAHFENDAFAATVVTSDPESDYWYWQGFAAGNASYGSAQFTLATPSADPSGSGARLRVSLVGASSTGVAGEHHVRVLLNGNIVGDGYWEGLTTTWLDLPFPAGWLQAGDNTVEVDAVADTGAPYSYFYLNSFDLSYPRGYSAVGDQLRFRGDGNGVVTVSGFDRADVSTFDVSDPLQPRLVNGVTVDQQAGGYRVTLQPGASEATYVAAAPPAFLQPKWLRTGNPTALKRGQPGADYLVITTAELLAPAQRLATLRSGSGLRPAVVDVEDVYDAFNFGIVSPHAISSFLAQAYSTWSPRPALVVLAGAGNLDYRDNLGYGGNLLPPLMASTGSGLFASDNLFAELPGGDATPQIAVGRLPVRTAAELDAVVSKLAAYEAAGGAAWRANALMAAGEADSGLDFPADSDALAAALPGGYAVERVYLGTLDIDSARTQLLAGIGAGAGLFNFIGHGGRDRLAAEGMLTNDDVATLGNGARLPILTALSCTINRFELPNQPCLGETLVRQADGGAAAVWAATGLSYDTEARALGTRFYYLLSQAKSPRLGELVRQALAGYSRGGGMPDIAHVYTLLGDPGMPLITPPPASPPGGSPGSGTKE
jgi:hypothetical protein